MYAIVRAGGRQEKVSVGDVVVADRVEGDAGTEVTLAPLLLVDGEAVTSSPADLAAVTVTAEIVDHSKGRKIEVGKYKNKTGYRRRQGHRQALTTLKVTGIKVGK